MIKTLKIKNFAILSDVEVSFNKGLNIITGETGSGKSLLIKAIKLISGEKVDKELMNKGLIDIQCIFDIKGSKNLIDLLTDEDLLDDKDADELLIRRVVDKDSNKIYINGSISSITTLKKISGYIINLCGQNDNIKITNESYQLSMLDSFCNNDKLLNDMSVVVQKISKIDKTIKEKLELDKTKEDQIGYLKYQLGDLNKLEIKEGEEEIVLEKIKKMQLDKEKNEIGNSFLALLEESDLSNQLDYVLTKANKIKNLDPEIQAKIDDINTLKGLTEKLTLFFAKQRKQVDTTGHDAIYAQLELINRIKKKHGSLEALFAKRKKLNDEMAAIDDNEYQIKKLGKERVELVKEYKVIADKISEIRKEKSKKLVVEINREIQELNMKGAEFEIRFTDLSEPNLKGNEKIEFFIATNKGFAATPLAKTASGGELSRIMLSLNKIISNNNDSSIMIFDEIDTGIGGETANIVGKKMHFIGKKNQVICISHQPQVAAYSSNHIMVSKSISNNKTSSKAVSLTLEEKVMEIARMIGGDLATDTAKKHAEEMIKNIK